MIDGASTPMSRIDSGGLLCDVVPFLNSLVILDGICLSGGIVYSGFLPSQGKSILGGVKTFNSKYYQYLLLIQHYFGEAVSQDNQFLFIKKADLEGLTSTANNTAESLLAAILSRIYNIKSDDTRVSAEFLNIYFNNGCKSLVIQVNCLQKPIMIDDEIQPIKNLNEF